MKFARLQKISKNLFNFNTDGKLLTRYENIEASNIPPLVQAYIGDAYFHLYIRRRLLSYEQNNVQILHTFGARIVSAIWQAKAYKGIETMLTEDEQGIFKRGRNAKSHTTRSASVAEYHASTGFEALLGTLYLRGDIVRLDEIAERAFQIIAQGIVDDK